MSDSVPNSVEVMKKETFDFINKFKLAKYEVLVNDKTDKGFIQYSFIEDSTESCVDPRESGLAILMFEDADMNTANFDNRLITVKGKVRNIDNALQYYCMIKHAEQALKYVH